MLLLSCRLYVFLWMLASPCANLAESSHFQGAAVSWHTGTIYEDEGIHEILIDFRIAWRRSSEVDSPSTYCDQEDVESGKLLGLGDSEPYQWTCKNGCNGTVAAAEVTCTQFDETDDWSLGVKTAKFNITELDPFEIEFSGCCWISTLVYGTDDVAEWGISTKGSVGTRSDTKKPNRSPISAATPTIRFQAGCPDYVDLVMYDADGDYVSCQFAECNRPSCSQYPYLKLSQQGKTCRLSYNAGGPGNTNVAISIVLEDRPRKAIEVNGVRQNTSTALSSVSLQFIVKLFNDIQICSLRPVWIEPTFPNGLVKIIVVGAELTIELRITSSESLLVVNVVGPVGLTKGPLANISETEYMTNLTFTPTDDQVGSHMVCIAAKDRIGKMSEQRCMVLIVGDDSPCQVNKGGCDDECVTSGNSYDCVCNRDCWRLAEDRRTCIPDIDIECKSDRFAITLPACAISSGSESVSIGYDHVTSTKTCEAERSDDLFSREVKYNECATETESDFTEIHYWNHVRMWVDDAHTYHGSGDEQNTITRGFYYNMQIVCSFSRYANVNATFRPIDREETLVRVPGLGSFQFFFDFYVDDRFGAAYSPYEYPITVTVNSDIYFGIRTVGGTGLQVFTEKCVAMTTPTPTDDTVLYTIIQDGCFSDATLQRYSAPSKMEDRYSIKAFRFQDNLNVNSESNIYIQCSAVLCVVGDPTTRCQKGCIRTRKRRDGEEEIYVDRHKREVEEEAEPTTPPNVSESNLLEITVSGPFRIEVEHGEGTPLVTVVTPADVVDHGTDAAPQETRKRNPTASTKKSESDPLTVVIIASSVGVVLFIILLAVLIGLFAYYHIVLHPRHKVIPDKEITPRSSMCSWTLDDRENPETPPKPETPPPSFWDVQPLT